MVTVAVLVEHASSIGEDRDGWCPKRAGDSLPPSSSVTCYRDVLAARMLTSLARQTAALASTESMPSGPRPPRLTSSSADASSSHGRDHATAVDPLPRDDRSSQHAQSEAVDSRCRLRASADVRADDRFCHGAGGRPTSAPATKRNVATRRC